MPNNAQSFQNHTRWVPGFHFVLLPMIMFNLVWAIVRVFRHRGPDTEMALLVAASLLLLALFARQFAVTVQDRVIRLEMRTRMRDVCPQDLTARFGEFTPGQLVALRFAGDAELPALARKVLDDKLVDRKTIKSMVKDWQPDNLRA